ncbi:xanthine and CO dehydrogenases maturation factor, XdhC/CoxF family [Desulfocapsa sulfexigens DSM 10523]|uniref:Xanthine and CO dehydrogenases maturation factor, XdhC/CoxF family n=1 Tax=Desulfocapsa sulfexigens (strain DSM 10523 / SB164P1) TaxID=1167006 RepID=M1PMS4_DESSD|nr:XdhC/CoxI family protein [Desulfocapsa sulfexigens]AGF77746.1 xanthine and CO dehydrogenases maturation factor, XdhC/CoxF family [Desulfocapsa sulfexigens DSM 10523]
MIDENVFNSLCKNKTRTVLATVIASDGRGPARPGDRLLWAAGQLITGTIGGGSNEQQILDACATLTTDEQRIEIKSILPGTLPSCGGTLQIRLEKIDFGKADAAAFWKKELTRNDACRLFLMGAGHVAREVAWVADRNGFGISIVDPRRELMQPEFFPENCSLSLQQGTQFLARKITTPKDFIIIAGPDHAGDLAVLEQATQSPALYIGVMGSKKKIASFKEILTKKNLWQTATDRIYAPIGIPISSRTPAEVAVSIVAELILVRAQSSTKQ